jgi:three-Cys-motif partner protein
LPPRRTDYEALLGRLRFEADGLPVRASGPWSRDKLALLGYYLQPFAKLCTRLAGGWYFVDGFAGNGVNRVPDFDLAKGTALLGLTTVPRPTGAILIELDAVDAEALDLRATRLGFPGVVTQGDCNQALPSRLRMLPDHRLPGVCVLDPEGLELDWSTIEACRMHRHGKWPFELLFYFSTPGAARTAGVEDERLIAANERRLTRLFGNESWKAIADEQRRGSLPPGEAGARYLDLYKAKLEGLGYRTLWRPALRVSGGLAYHLIFASANDRGLKIMEYAMARAFGSNRPLALF